MYPKGRSGPSRVQYFFYFYMDNRLFDEEILINVEKGSFYLDEIFQLKENCGIYGDMMNTRRNQISFLNKGLCGNGGTTGLIRYALKNSKGLLVLVPNVSICKSKERDYKDNPNVCCVYGGVQDFDADSQITIATYDQFASLLKKLKSSGLSGDDIWEMRFWGGRTIIVDEYHKLIDDSGYREVCHKMTELISKTDSPFILMSATPKEDYILMLRDLLPERRILNYIVKYPHQDKNTTKIDVYEIKHKDLCSIFKKMKESPRQVCVFYNSVSDIKNILGQIGDEDCEVLCSTNSKDKVGKYYSEVFNPAKKMHFMTSAYFTGHDIWTPVDKCVIVGSGDRDNMCLSERDIKQIIGRFRMAGGGARMDDVHLLYMQRQIDQKNYMTNKNIYEQTARDMALMGNKWMLLSDGIKKKHDNLRTKDALRRYDMWSSYNHLEKALLDYGFMIVNNTKFLKNLREMDKKKHISFQQAKERLIKGKNVDFDEYPDVNELMEFMAVKGKTELMSKRTSKEYIHNWYKAYGMSKNKDLGKYKGHLYEAFGIQTFGRYNAKYLMACLGFIDDESDYDNLSIMMYEKMGCLCIPWKQDNSGHCQNNTWLVITVSPKNEGKKSDILYSDDNTSPTIFGETVIESLISYEVSNQGSSYARTISWKDAVRSGNIASLTGIPLYDWVNEDKPSRLPKTKGGKDWSNIKRFRQTKISDMYKATEKVYRYIRSEVNLADCLIIDIDSGYSFEDFKKRYAKWTWYAYPTINNVAEDWAKYRVIVPLAHTIRIDGEHNLKVMKCLRAMFCPYEDPEHQVYSYINLEDFARLKGNVGETYAITQELIDCLAMCMKESYDYNSRKFNKKKVNIDCSQNGALTLNEAKTMFLNSLADKKEGARHYILYPIKKRLSEEDRLDFEEWLAKVYPAYISHWNSHRV